MCDDNYPPGAANDPNAPYNKVNQEPIEFTADITYNLNGIRKFESTEYEGGLYEDDEEGCCYRTNAKYIGDNLAADLKDKYYTPTQLFEIFSEEIRIKILQTVRLREYAAKAGNKRLVLEAKFLRSKYECMLDSIDFDTEELDVNDVFE